MATSAPDLQIVQTDRIGKNRGMKLPRWLVVAMLSASTLVVLSSASAWWVIWPEHKARTLLHMLDRSEQNDAKRRFCLSDLGLFLLLENYLQGSSNQSLLDRVRSEPRTLREV